jgi:[ribosomal protein S18]-alanine N-acetyltransferase
LPARTIRRRCGDGVAVTHPARLRPVTPFDLDLVAMLQAACFPDAWSAASIGALLAGPGAFGLIASVDDEPGGFILVRPAADEAEILSLGVLPALRRQGLARALLTAALARLSEAGIRRLLLEVAEDNVAARRLYQGAGLVPVGRRRGYYRQVGEAAKTALVMALALGAISAAGGAASPPARRPAAKGEP